MPRKKFKQFSKLIIVLGLIIEVNCLQAQNVNVINVRSTQLPFQYVQNIHGSTLTMLWFGSSPQNTKLFSSERIVNRHNILFVDQNTQPFKWLFEHDDFMIRKVTQLTTPSVEKGQSKKESETQITQALYIEFVSKDSDQDQQLTTNDTFNVLLAKPSATKITTILQDIQRVISYDNQGDWFVIIYQKNNQIRQAKYLLNTFELEFDRELVNLAKIK